MPRFGQIFSAAIAAALLWGGAAHAQSTIRIGLDAESYPPFFSKGPDGKWVGWEIDLLGAVCRQLGADCPITEIAWDGLIPSLQQNRIDLIWSSMTITAERRQVIDFTAPYHGSETLFIGPKEDATKVDCAQPDSFSGKVIGVQAGTNHSAFVEARFTGKAEIKTYDKLDNALADLTAGRVDYVQESKGTLGHFLASADGADFEVKSICPADPVLGEGVGGGLRKGDEALRETVSGAIRAVVQSGEWDAITAKYPGLSEAITKPQ